MFGYPGEIRRAVSATYTIESLIFNARSIKHDLYSRGFISGYLPAAPSAHQEELSNSFLELSHLKIILVTQPWPVAKSSPKLQRQKGRGAAAPSPSVRLQTSQSLVSLRTTSCLYGGEVKTLVGFVNGSQ